MKSPTLRLGCAWRAVLMSCALALLCAGAQGQTTAVWINPAGGSFGDGPNWSTGVVPGPGDTAEFSLSGLYTVTLDADRTLTDVVNDGSGLTLDLGTHTLTARLVQHAGAWSLTNGSTSGPVLIDGGALTVESSCRMGVHGGPLLQNGAQLLVRGYMSDLILGGGFSTGTFDPGTMLTIELGASLVLEGCSCGGTSQVMGRLHCEWLNQHGVMDINGGYLEGEGIQYLMGGVARFHAGGRTNGAGGGMIDRGEVLVEGAGTNVYLARVESGRTTVRDGGLVNQGGELGVVGTGALVIGGGGSVARPVYRRDSGLLRLEPGSVGPMVELLSDTPDVRLELVMDGARTPEFDSRALWYYSAAAQLNGSLGVEVVNPNGLRRGDQIVLLTRNGAPITGNFGTVEAPALGGGRVLQLQVTTQQVVLNVVPGGDPCWGADFDGDGDVGTDADIAAFFACLAGNCCGLCASADFDSDGDVATDADIEAFFRVLAGGSC